MNWSVVLPAVAVAVVALCAVTGYFFLRRSAAKTESDFVIKELLDSAVAQRSIMVVEFKAPGTICGRLSGPCISFEPQGLRIDSSLRGEIPEWMGKPVQVDFNIKKKGTVSCYRFTGRVCGMPYRAGAHDLLLESPNKIKSVQKRRSMRIPLPSDVTFGVGVWVLKPGEVCPEIPSALGSAMYSYRRDRTEQLALLNLSAGGLLIRLRPKEGDKNATMQPGTRLLCLVLLRSAEEEGSALPFWLDCAITHRHDPGGAGIEKGTITFGLSFQAWAVPSEDKGAVTWFPVGENGTVGPLAAWVLRRQMEHATQAR